MRRDMISRRAIALAAAGVLLAGERAAIAQTVLPGIIVEGTTIAVRPLQPAKPQPTAPQGPRAPGGAPTGPIPAGDAPALPAGGASEAAQAGAGQLAANQGTAVTVITAEELRAQQIRTPVEALRSLPGVGVNRTGSFAGLTQVRIRGAEANHTVVLIDGIEANTSADGEFDFANLTAGEEIERIEVLRGPQSGLYGSGAMGGVINVVTRSGRGPLTLAARSEIGSFNTKDAALALSGGSDNVWGVVSVGTRKTGGFNISATGEESDGYQLSAFHFKGGVRVLDALTIEGVMRHTSKRGDRDEEDFTVPLPRLVPQIDAPSRFSTNLWLSALEARLALLDGHWLSSVRVERNATRNDDLSISPLFGRNYEAYESTTDKLRFTSTLRLETAAMPGVRHFLTGMAEHTDESFTVFTADSIERERARRSLAGEIRGEYWDQLFLAASVRRDDNDVLEDFTTWRTSASLRPLSGPLRLHASAGTGVKFPSLFEQFGRFPTFFVPNPNLKPETTEGWDAGAELAFASGQALIDVTFFKAEIESKIRRSGVTVINQAGISPREGIEVTGRLALVPGLTIGAGYTYLLAREATGLDELRRPRHSGRLDVAYTFDRGRARVGLAALYNGAMFDEPINSSFQPVRTELDAYWLLTATASYKLTPDLELYGRVENVLDTRYQEVFGFETAGLAAYAGLRIRLEDRSGLLAPAR